MSTRLLFLSAPALIVLVSLYAAAQPPGKATTSPAGSPVPEMARLATALVGDWKTAETRVALTMQRQSWQEEQ